MPGGVNGIDWVINGGAIGLLVGVVTALLLGRLIPRRTHDSQIKGIKEVADLWKSAAETKEKTLATVIPLLEMIKENDQATAAMISGIKTVVEEIARQKKTGGADVEA